MAFASFVNLFCEDLDRLTVYYAGLFGFDEIPENRSPTFRSLRSGECRLGLSARSACSYLGMSEFPAGSPSTCLLTLQVEDIGTVDQLATLAVELGGALLKAPADTPYGWRQAVLADPEGNAFRISALLS